MSNSSHSTCQQCILWTVIDDDDGKQTFWITENIFETLMNKLIKYGNVNEKLLRQTK